ncbi:MAG: hypothetical protein HKN25_06590 [Pyrinomonadaceae bacterium]|nr:hypothetical protein [Pyrinomonadaceae bacterium]
MTYREHTKLLAGFFFISGVLQTLGWVLVGGWMGGNWLLLMFGLFYMLTGWKLQNDQSDAKIFGTIASVLCLPNLPLGTALGIYGLWFFWFRR